MNNGILSNDAPTPIPAITASASTVSKETLPGMAMMTGTIIRTPPQISNVRAAVFWFLLFVRYSSHVSCLEVFVC